MVGDNVTDALALRELQSALDCSPAPWPLSSDASCPGPCSPACPAWHGVACLEGRVSNVTLTGASCRGTLPPASARPLSALRKLTLRGCGVRGTLSPYLVSLQALRYLTLSNNDLSGTLPENLSALSSLVTLDLSFNAFSGTLPPSWGAFARMRELALQQNALAGTLPQSWVSMPALQLVVLSGNCALCGPPPPVPASFGGTVVVAGTAIGAPCSRSNCQSQDGASVSHALLAGIIVALLLLGAISPLLFITAYRTLPCCAGLRARREAARDAQLRRARRAMRRARQQPAYAAASAAMPPGSWHGATTLLWRNLVPLSVVEDHGAAESSTEGSCSDEGEACPTKTGPIIVVLAPDGTVCGIAASDPDAPAAGEEEGSEGEEVAGSGAAPAAGTARGRGPRPSLARVSVLAPGEAPVAAPGAVEMARRGGRETPAPDV